MGKIFRELRQKSAFFAMKNEKNLIGWKKCGKRIVYIGEDVHIIST